jgi:O-methyltransferase
MNKIEEQDFLNKMHGNLDLDKFIKIIFKDSSIGGINFINLLAHCFNQTGTPSQPFKLIRRSERLMILLKLLIYATENNKGPIAECGVFKGFSSLAMKLVLSNINRSNNIYLIDSFEGLSEPVTEDLISYNKDSVPVKGFIMSKGHFATPVENIVNLFDKFENINIVKGWIPAPFQYLPDEEWSFVHLDVDLYKPIIDSLEFFYPRMKSGGVILNDDYNSPYFPGAGIAWREFFESKKEHYIILDSGQSVFIKK